MTKKQRRLNVIRLPEVCEKVGLSKPTIYRLMAAGKFPKSMSLTDRAVGWLEKDVDDFILARCSA